MKTANTISRRSARVCGWDFCLNASQYHSIDFVDSRTQAHLLVRGQLIRIHLPSSSPYSPAESSSSSTASSASLLYLPVDRSQRQRHKIFRLYGYRVAQAPCASQAPRAACAFSQAYLSHNKLLRKPSLPAAIFACSELTAFTSTPTAMSQL